MKRILLLTWVSVLCAMLSSSPVRAEALLTELNLANGWRITQDVRDLGERMDWYKPEFAADWQPIDRLTHLQLLLAKQPYFGRELRYFNEHAWWYRVQFPPSAAVPGATLRFDGVDYFSKVWLNGILLGEHEGYADPFEFEVGTYLRTDKENVLIVKVSSPWDHEYANTIEPIESVVRNLQKGTYEHADSLIQRDVNPVGIWRPVRLIFHGSLHANDLPAVTTILAPDQKAATVKVVWSVLNEGAAKQERFDIRIREKGGAEVVASTTQSVRLEKGLNDLTGTALISSPKLWSTWDRGGQPLYEAKAELVPSNGQKLTSSVGFGIRSVELHRSADETRFFINGKPIYLRGTTYWPDLYISKMSRARYERDIQAAVHAGFNAFRIHVHTENPEFYELCDQLGIVVIQDNDLNWRFPQTPEFATRAVDHFGSLIKLLSNHPSIIGWIALNEVGNSDLNEAGEVILQGGAQEKLGPLLVAEANRRDPTRPVIEDSWDVKSLASGDSHDYRGSLFRGKWTYFDIFPSKDKFVTEFGADVPASVPSLRAIPELAARLKNVLPRVSELHDYQYRLLKYYIEHYRIQKYAPNAGYFQFMWIDLAPQSFYGIYDYWGIPKTEGLGGGLRALMESNQPVGIFMEHNTRPVSLYAVNDSPRELGDCVAWWRVSEAATVIAEGSQPVRLGPDSRAKVRDMDIAVRNDLNYTIELRLVSADGKTLARNSYEDPFKVRGRPEGYPEQMDGELGMRVWWAGQSKSQNE